MDIYLVGGAVRDTLLNYPFHERDWVVVGAHPEELLALGYQQVGKDFPVFLHPETKEEYALARTERKTGHGYQGFSCYAAPDVSLEEDLARRDLTINAMAMDSNNTIIDPYHGQQDLQQKKLRHVSEAFTEDPLRVLRVARFYARYYHLGFTLDDKTFELLKSICQSGELQHLSQERVWKETERALAETSPAQYFLLLKSTGALSQLIPPLAELEEVQFLQIDSLQHNDKQQLTQLRFAILFHGLNKTVSQKALNNVKTPNDYRDLALLVAEHSQSFLQYEQQKQEVDSEDLLARLQQLDPFRKPERFALLLQAFQALGIHTMSEFLNEVYGRCQTINAKQFAQQGLTGKAIGEAIQSSRLKIIEQLKHECLHE